ncbi:O-linked N-acetylglucosamine transferase family protein [Pelotalea chapellei]|uniref:protein O-GlcNAc transferase n=1 Tax=Pelotalea chapellei TaxID=44671 RepID=A0ABS5UAN1_9BACT|nr:tetratricopeptide repeat protein [Pelotalea chapellei]MBT1072719.1 tetratricopeptide repeat protein [Pelotalea chapellei]
MSSCEIKISSAIRLHQAGQYEKAEAIYRDVLVAEPDNFDALHLLGVLASQVGRPDEALELLGRAVQKHKAQPTALISLGNTLTSLGRYDEAVKNYRHALDIEPNCAGTHYNLGNVLHFLDRNDEAVACYRKALNIKPDYTDVYNHLGNVFRKLGRLLEAEENFRRALELNPNAPGVHNNLGNILMDLGRLDEAESSFRRALELRPDYYDAHSNLLLLQTYSVHHDGDSHLELARSYGCMVGRRAAEKFTSWTCEQPPERLRVGLVSGDLNNHPVGYFLENVLAQLNTSRIELLAYATQRTCDDLTARIMPSFTEWRQLQGLDDRAAAHLIHGDGVHILIDLAGHTAHNRLPVFAWKPAPIQVCWLGYGSTTGVAEIDYILGNPYSTPTKDAHRFTETIWQMPETSLCFSLPNVNLEVAPLPALSNGFVTFGCFNNLAKLNDEVVGVWARILKAVPNSRLFLKNKQLGESAVCRSVIERFAARGVSGERLLLEGRSPRAEYLKAYSRVDIVLDPFPFPGGTTTVEGLWMGVPFITRQGNRLISHQGEMIAHNCELLSGWIAKDDDEYVAKVLNFSSDMEYLKGLRAILRRHLLLSPLFNASRFALNLDAALWEMWERFET